MSENSNPLGDLNPEEDVELSENINYSNYSLPLGDTNPVENTESIDQFVDIPKASNNDSGINKIRWEDDFIIVKHRFRHQWIEYFVKQRLDPDSLGVWKKGSEINNNPITIDYMAQLPKPNTRSRQRGSQNVNKVEYVNNTISIFSGRTSHIPITTTSIIDKIRDRQVDKQEITIPLDKTPAVNLIFKSKCVSPRPQSKLIFLFYFTFILSINHFDCLQPDLGSLYDCRNVTKVGLYSVPPETYCS